MGSKYDTILGKLRTSDISEGVTKEFTILPADLNGSFEVTLNHGLDTEFILVGVWDNTGKEATDVSSIDKVDTDNLKLTFAGAIGGTYYALITCANGALISYTPINNKPADSGISKTDNVAAYNSGATREERITIQALAGLLNLNDIGSTPALFTASKNVRVNSAGTGIEYSNKMWVITKTANFTLSDTEEGAYLKVDSSSSIVITIPEGLTEDYGWIIKRKGTGAVTLTPSGSATINGATSSVTINDGGSVFILANASNDVSVDGDTE